MSKVFVWGDVHGGYAGTLSSVNHMNWPEGQTLDGDDVLVQLGDLGFWWSHNPDKKERAMRREFCEKNYQFCFIDGNHENFAALELDFKTEIRFGAPAGVYSPEGVDGEIIWLRRGYVYTIADQRFWIFGGAASIDRAYRTEGVSWWPEELPNRKEIDRGVESFENIDYVLTHTCPWSVISYVLDYGVPQSDICSQLFGSLLDGGAEFKQWYFGHFHVNRTFEYKDWTFTCCYGDVKPSRVI